MTPAKRNRTQVQIRQFELGSLPAFEYGMLRAAIVYAIEFCESMANAEGPDAIPGNRKAVKLWRDRQSEFRALLARFGKEGRRGKR